MANFEVRDVVCDYGVYENGELKLILNSRGIAENIVQLLEEDARLHRRLNPIKDYPPYLDCPKHYSQESDKTEDKLNLIDMNSINAIAGYLRWIGKIELAEILFYIQEKAIRLLDKYESLKKENQASLQMVGDVVYALWETPTLYTETKYVLYSAEVKEVSQCKRNNRLVLIYKLEPTSFRGRIREFFDYDFGKTVFLTKEEAEQALKGGVQE